MQSEENETSEQCEAITEWVCHFAGKVCNCSQPARLSSLLHSAREEGPPLFHFLTFQGK